jgi:hypothetical protein
VDGGEGERQEDQRRLIVELRFHLPGRTRPATSGDGRRASARLSIASMLPEIAKRLKVGWADGGVTDRSLAQL